MNREQKVTLLMIAVMVAMTIIAGVLVSSTPDAPTFTVGVLGAMIGLVIATSVFVAAFWNRIGRDL